MRISLVALLAVCLFISCEKQPDFTYYTAPDKQTTITLVRQEGHVYFTPGRYSKQAVPTWFIQPTSGIDHSYLAFIHWCGPNKVEVLSPYGK